MKTVAENILSEANMLPEGALISAKEFLHLGSRAAVDQALKRLKERKELMPLCRGVYVRPVKTRFGMRAPAAEKVIERFARDAGRNCRRARRRRSEQAWPDDAGSNQARLPDFR
jgi:hypothetical protein